jgi:hypothetical protein
MDCALNDREVVLVRRLLRSPLNAARLLAALNRAQTAPLPPMIRLSSDLEARLNRLASETARTKAFDLRRLIEENIDDLEDVFLLNLDSCR